MRGFHQVSGQIKPKKVLLEVYDNAEFTFKNCEFKEATLGILISEASSKSRTQAKEDSALKFLGGLCAKDESKRPPFTQAMMEMVPDGSILSYMMPQDKDNLTALSEPNGVSYDTCPGAWCMQIASGTTEGFEMAMKAFFEHAILNAGGWTHVPRTKLVQRLANPSGKPGDGWWEQMQITIAPRGPMRVHTADLLHKLLQMYPFLHWDGSMAYAPDTSFKRCCSFECKSGEEADEVIMKRDSSLVQEYNKTDSNDKNPLVIEDKDMHKGIQSPSSIVSSPGRKKDELNFSRGDGSTDTPEGQVRVQAFSKEAQPTAGSDASPSQLQGRVALPVKLDFEMPGDASVEEMVTAQVLLTELNTVREKVTEEYSSTKESLLAQKKWDVLKAMKCTQAALEPAFTPTLEELCVYQRNPDDSKLHQKMKYIVAQASNEHVSRLLFAFHDLIGRKMMWSTLVSETCTGQQDNYEKELNTMKEAIKSGIDAQKHNVVDATKVEKMSKYTEMHNRATELLEKKVALATENEDWELAEEIDVVKINLAKISPAEIQHQMNSSDFEKQVEDAEKELADILSTESPTKRQRLA